MIDGIRRLRQAPSEAVERRIALRETLAAHSGMKNKPVVHYLRRGVLQRLSYTSQTISAKG